MAVLVEIHRQRLNSPIETGTHEHCFREREDMNIIVVSGLPRSGTSLMMQALGRGGIKLYWDHKRKADRSNPKGYFEHEAVKRLARDSSWLDGAKNKAVKIVSPLLVHLPASHGYKIIFMQRDLDEILESQAKMLAREGKIDNSTHRDQLKTTFEKHLAQIERWIQKNENATMIFVNYLDLIKNPEQELEKTREFLQRDLDVESMVSVVDPSLYRVRKKVSGSETT